MRKKVEPICQNCALELDEWMGGYVHAVNGAKVCPGLVGVAKPR